MPFLFMSLLLLLCVFSDHSYADEACPAPFFPLSFESDLLINQQQSATLLSLQNRAQQCPQLAADLAQLYFWGNSQLAANWQKAKSFLSAHPEAIRYARTLGELHRLESASEAERISAQNLLRLQLDDFGLQRDKTLAAWHQYQALTAENAAQLSGGYNLDKGYEVWREPHHQLGKLLVYADLASGERFDTQCTANVINGRWLITAAHCVFIPAELGQGKLLSVSFLPFEAGSGLLSAQAVNAIWVGRAFDPSLRMQGDVLSYTGADIALLELAKPLLHRQGQHEFSPQWVVSEGAALSAPVITTGFPKDAPWARLRQFQCAASLFDPSRKEGVYTLSCLMQAGQSGSLIYDVQGHWLGVLSASVNGEQSVARFFSQPLIEEIKQITEQREGRVQFFQKLDWLPVVKETVGRDAFSK
ncbi:trypsin-like peptidase domain-containing protein [Spongiibacter sp. KMU-158]|uniref:Trypsin-like peptidase domain-containing protein n=1 Tax=Spongiibacter pelagi TaxID=2760804 RepID=A0A927C313_9GAMM|nr:trypsin-like peptidase domain-containing protein [Spongiibacter pelagi]MBD2859223.1 trypsin-like peptidase domain-containing protein [Spongiibacter pelagi]